MAIIGRVEIAWQASGFTVRANIDRVTNSAVKSSTDDVEHAAAREQEMSE